MKLFYLIIGKKYLSQSFVNWNKFVSLILSQSLANWRKLFPPKSSPHYGKIISIKYSNFCHNLAIAGNKDPTLMPKIF